MSAIAGLWRFGEGPEAAGACAAMLDAQRLYGPHAADLWDGGDVALGRRLFHTLPEDRFDSGPVALAGGGRLTADVRLDNRPELESDLGLEPERARTLADVALLAEAWTRWGEACFDRLVGVYALAVWDPSTQRLILARDPFGQRPLHYHRARGFIAVASMPMGLHALADVPLEPDEDHLAAFMALRAEHGPATFFKGVERVEPGAVAAFDRHGVTLRRHYAPARRPLRLARPDDYVEALREQLDRAVAAQLRGAGSEVAAHLSSGWDSAAVAATAARLMRDRRIDGRQGRVLALTAAPRAGSDSPAPRGRHADETPGAAAVAALYDNMDHVIVRGGARSPLDDLDRDIALCGQPPLNPCNHLWLNDINRAARTHGARVLLTGDFGNLGLTDDGVECLPDLAIRGRWLEWLDLARAVRRGGVLRWQGVIAHSFENHLLPGAWAALRRLKGQTDPGRGAHSPLPPALWARLSERPRDRRGDWTLRRLGAMTRFERAPYVKGALAGTGVDMRDPLADRRLVEFCLSVPVEQLISDGRPRALARRALGDRLPEAILEGRTRGYQGADWHEGLTRDPEAVTRDLDRLDALPAGRRLLDIDRLRGLARTLPDGDWASERVIDAYRLALLRGLSAGRFLTHTLRPNG